ncbi:MAG: hypothetical protein OEN23_14980 [Paracoccaceae bacterium]|nr:hypothetical protein [Paracoccaceae bacterium]
MSETDSFIQEVTEEVRQDRMFRLWKKYGPYAIAGVILVVAIAAGLNWMNHREIQAARAVGGAFLNSDMTSVDDQEVLLGSVEGAAAEVAKMRLAAAKATEGDVEGAVALYDEVAASGALSDVYTQLAQLQAVRVQAASLATDQGEARLAPLVAEGAPYRLLALELRALIRLNAGETEAAHQDLAAIVRAPLATRASRERAIALLASSGGDLAELTQ